MLCDSIPDALRRSGALDETLQKNHPHRLHHLTSPCDTGTRDSSLTIWWNRIAVSLWNLLGAFQDLFNRKYPRIRKEYHINSSGTWSVTAVFVSRDSFCCRHGVHHATTDWHPWLDFTSRRAPLLNCTAAHGSKIARRGSRRARVSESFGGAVHRLCSCSKTSPGTGERTDHLYVHTASNVPRCAFLLYYAVYAPITAHVHKKTDSDPMETIAPSSRVRECHSCKKSRDIRTPQHSSSSMLGYDTLSIWW